jgi:hypothetical protein
MGNNFVSAFERNSIMLTEGAVGQRLERAFGLSPDKDIMYASLLYSDEGKKALRSIYSQYLQIAETYKLPILLMTNTRRANQERVANSAYRHKFVAS